MTNNILTTIDLEKFEQHIFSGNHCETEHYFYLILDFFVKEGCKSIPEHLVAKETNGDLCHLLTRLCSAIAQIVVLPEFQLTISNLDKLVTYQMVISRIFALTPFKNTDYLVQHLLRPDENGLINNKNIIKAYFLFSTESKLTTLLRISGNQNIDLYLTTCLMLIWACSGSEQSCANREWAYAESTKILEKSTELNIPISFIHGFLMHASYGFSQNKHDLKKHINRLLSQRLPPYNPRGSSLNSLIPQKDEIDSKFKKPVLLIVLEIFNPHHSVYRVFAPSLQACKERFTLIAVTWPDFVHHIPNDFFDIQITLSGIGENYCLEELFGIIEKYEPVGVYYPSIGMSPWAIHYSNVRLAPIQFTTAGHAASSFATQIDYFLVEEDIAGNSDTYSEILVKLPIGSMPFCAPSGVEYHIRKLSLTTKPQNDVVQIVCCATTIKLNAKLLKFCQKIDQKYYVGSSKKLIEFTFLISFNSGGVDFEIYRQLMLEYLPNVTIHISLPFQAYLDVLAKMDIALSPFPYGNMNGLIDCAILGVVGVCMEGPQIHESIDGGMMRRMCMPEWLIAKNEEQYEKAVCRLIDNDSERLSIRKALLSNKKYQSFFNGDASIFANYVTRMISGEFKDISSQAN